MSAIYMAVTVDKYELPLAVADTAKQIGEIFGLKANTVTKSLDARRISSGKNRGVKFVKINDEDEGETT